MYSIWLKHACYVAERLCLRKTCSLREVLSCREYHVLSGKASQPVETKRKFSFEPLFTENNIFEKFLQTHLRTHEIPATFLNFARNDALVLKTVYL